MAEPITSFTGLVAWQEGHCLVVIIYRATATFPKREQFALGSQMERAAVSFTSNIAEGFSRSTRTDKRHFFTTALASLTELQNQLLVARDIGYLPRPTFDTLAAQSMQARRLVWGLLKSAQSRRRD